MAGQGAKVEASQGRLAHVEVSAAMPLGCRRQLALAGSQMRVMNGPGMQAQGAGEGRGGD
jgi:hypothetical protein